MTISENPTAKVRGVNRVKDARGRTVTQLDPVRLQVWHRYDVIEADALERIVEELEPGTARMRRRMLVMVPSAILLLALGIAALYYFSDSSMRRDLVSTLTNPVIIVPNVLCCVFIPWLTTRQARLKRARFAMLKHRRCPHCCYDLRLLPTDPTDGATVCPECGCARLLDDAVLTERLAATATPGVQVGRQKKMLVLVALLLGVMALAGLLMSLRMR